MHTGSCLCQKVTFTVTGPLPGPDACHCTDCRKFSGHYFTSTDVPRVNLKIQGEENLNWFHTREAVRRGFCSTCGSSLFWDPIHHDWIGIAMGAFDTPTHTQTHLHIWTSDKGDYYAITDGLPQHAEAPMP